MLRPRVWYRYVFRVYEEEGLAPDAPPRPLLGNQLYMHVLVCFSDFAPLTMTLPVALLLLISSWQAGELFGGMENVAAG